MSFDAIVVGGGVVGATAALGVARAGRSVLLVERAPPRPVAGTFGMDIRNIACSPASRGVLETVGAWRDLRPAPYRRMRVWEERGVSELEFDAAEIGRQELGWILENGELAGVLWSLLLAEPRVQICRGAVADLEVGAEEVLVRVEPAEAAANDGAGARPGGASGSRLDHRGSLLVAADGARSAVRELLEVGLDSHQTGHHALATLARCEHPHGGVAQQHFLLDGPLALLPSREADVVSVVWSQPPAQAARRMTLSDEAFGAELTEAAEWCHGRVVEVDRRIEFPLAQQLATDFNPRGRVLLIGDAARVLHPLAGLGANVGFEDVRDLLARLDELPDAADPGAAGLWRGYARKRRARARLMLAAMTTFKNLYAQGDPWRQWLRNTGIALVNDARPLKQQIIREALGFGPLAATW